MESKTKCAHKENPSDVHSSSELLDSSPETRRHSISCADSRDRSILHSASDTRLPLRILARSMAPARSGVSVTPAAPLSSIDVKFIQMYVKKIRPEYRQNSDPTFNCPNRGQLSSETTTGSNSAQSSSRASSNDEFPAIHIKSPDQKSIIVAPLGKNKQLPKITKRWASGSDLKEVAAKIDQFASSCSELSNSVVTCYRILESLFAGGNDAAMNAPLLCRLKIDHLIDLRSSDNHSPARTTSVNFMGVESPYPCVCPDLRHQRHPVRLRITDSKFGGNLIENYQRLNTLITTARVRGERTLLFDEEGRGMAPAAVVEYLMYYYHMKYAAAKAFVGEIIADMEVPNYVEKGLIAWQEQLSRDAAADKCYSASCGFRRTAESEELPPWIQRKKDAWI